MQRILVVANQTLGGDRLLEQLRGRVEQGECALHVLVPASADPSAWAHDLDGDRQLAERRLAQALERFSGLGADVSGEVGDPRPVDAVLDVLRREPFDEVIVSTLPVHLSRWLRLDLVKRIERAVSIPVTHVVGQDTSVSTG